MIVHVFPLSDWTRELLCFCAVLTTSLTLLTLHIDYDYRIEMPLALALLPPWLVLGARCTCNLKIGCVFCLLC